MLTTPLLTDYLLRLDHGGGHTAQSSVGLPGRAQFCAFHEAKLRALQSLGHGLGHPPELGLGRKPAGSWVRKGPCEVVKLFNYCCLWLFSEVFCFLQMFVGYDELWLYHCIFSKTYICQTCLTQRIHASLQNTFNGIAHVKRPWKWQDTSL